MREHNTEEYELQNQSCIFQQLEKISYKNLFIKTKKYIKRNCKRNFKCDFRCKDDNVRFTTLP